MKTTYAKIYKRKVYSVDETIHCGYGLKDPARQRPYFVQWMGELNGKQEPKARWFATKSEAQLFINNLKMQLA